MEPETHRCISAISLIHTSVQSVESVNSYLCIPYSLVTPCCPHYVWYCGLSTFRLVVHDMTQIMHG